MSYSTNGIYYYYSNVWKRMGSYQAEDWLPVKLHVYTCTFWVEVSKSRNDKLTVWALGTYQLPNTELFKGVPVQALT